MSRMTSAPAPSGRLEGAGDEILASIVDATSAPRRPQAAGFVVRAAVAMTFAPKALPSWIAVVPMPEAPPWTSRVSPRLQAAAIEHVGPDGEEGLRDRRRLDVGQARRDRQRVDFVRDAIFGIAAAGNQRDHARRPSRWRDGARAAAQRRSPATSRPRMSVAPGGGAYWPCRCSTSGRLTPAAATLIRISPAPATGQRALDDHQRPRGRPGRTATTARIVSDGCVMNSPKACSAT